MALLDHCIVEDKLGQLPCDVAFSRGNVDILSLVCVCKNGVHKEIPIFYERYLLFNSLKQKDDKFVSCVQSLSEYLSEGNIENITSVPFLGLVSIHKEAEEVKMAIVNIVNDICKRMGEKDELLQNSVYLSGSVGESTKVGLPDEFDFVCILDKMSQVLDLEEYNETNEVDVKLRKQFAGGLWDRFFDDKCSLTTTLIDRIFAIINEVLQEPDIYTHPNLFRVQNGFQKLYDSPNFKLKFRWSSCQYKNMTVKIDLVPAFKVRCNHDAKFYTERFNSTTNKSELLIMFRIAKIKSSSAHAISLYRNAFCEISASSEEREHLNALSSLAKDAYVISKILCTWRVCPIVLNLYINNTKYNDDSILCSDIISSYMLKNCLFYVAEEKEKTPISQISVHEYVCEIFQKLLQFANQETFPCFMFPSKDLFQHRDGHRSSEICMARAMYVKIILNILGKTYDFDDIYINISGIHRIHDTNTVVQDNNICACCKKSPEKDGVTLKACSRCKVWTYCRDICKKNNFTRHKPACDYHFN